MSHALTAAPSSLWRGLVPAGFVALWATGFFIGKLGLADAPPFTILFLRFALAALLMAAAALPLRSAWPRSRRQAGHLAVVGILLRDASISAAATPPWRRACRPALRR